MSKVGSISDIQIGYTARGRLESMSGGVPAIQLRNIAPDGDRNGESVERFRLGEIPSRYWVQSGDVLFRSRGDINTAVVLGDELPEPAVAVMPLVILRAKASILPGYLAWYLNQPEAQRHFDRGARGTGIRMIPMTCLSALEVPVPDIATQRVISEIDCLAKREFELATRLADRRRQLITASLLRVASESIHNTTRTTAAAMARPDTEGKP